VGYDILDAGRIFIRSHNHAYPRLFLIPQCSIRSASFARAHSRCHPVGFKIDGWSQAVTPLFVAIKVKRVSVVRLLLEAGADVHFELTDGVSALIFARVCGGAVITQLCQEAAKPFKRDSLVRIHGLVRAVQWNGASARVIKCFAGERAGRFKVQVEPGEKKLCVHRDNLWPRFPDASSQSIP
jgi:hypothetical protein